jgi:hypothetical protein
MNCCIRLLNTYDRVCAKIYETTINLSINYSLNGDEAKSSTWGKLKMHLYQHFMQMEQRPGLYPCESVEDVFKFVYGYSCAVDEQNVDDDLRHFSNFTSFVQEYFYFPSTHGNWATIIKYHTATNQESIQIFFKIFHEYEGTIKPIPIKP